MIECDISGVTGRMLGYLKVGTAGRVATRCSVFPGTSAIIIHVAGTEWDAVFLGFMMERSGTRYYAGFTNDYKQFVLSWWSGTEPNRSLETRLYQLEKPGPTEEEVGSWTANEG